MLMVFTSSVISSNTSTCNRRVDSSGTKYSEDLLLLLSPLIYDSKINKNTRSPQYTYVDIRFLRRLGLKIFKENKV